MFKKAYYHGVPCMFNEVTKEIYGRNWFYDILVQLNIWLDVNVFEVEGFEIYIEKDE